MNNDHRRVVRAVLRSATRHPNFFDLSQVEQLNWMIWCAYRLGESHGRGAVPSRRSASTTKAVDGRKSAKSR